MIINHEWQCKCKHYGGRGRLYRPVERWIARAGSCRPAGLLSQFFPWCILTESLLFLPACKTLLNKKSDGVKVSCITCRGAYRFVTCIQYIFLSSCPFYLCLALFFSLLTCISVFIDDKALISHFRFTLCSVVLKKKENEKKAEIKKKKSPIWERETSSLDTFVTGQNQVSAELTPIAVSDWPSASTHAVKRHDQRGPNSNPPLHTETNPTAFNERAHAMFLTIQFSF